jgi:hypothetical protein
MDSIGGNDPFADWAMVSLTTSEEEEDGPAMEEISLWTFLKTFHT